MTPELQAYYEDRFELMSLPGWKELIKDIKVMLDVTNTLSGIDTVEKLHFRKGEISIMNWLLSLQTISEDTYAELIKGEDENT